MFRVVIMYCGKSMEKNDFKIEISQENLEKWQENGDIRHLDDVVTISIPEDIVKNDKKDLEDIKKLIQVFKT